MSDENRPHRMRLRNRRGSAIGDFQHKLDREKQGQDNTALARMWVEASLNYYDQRNNSGLEPADLVKAGLLALRKLEDELTGAGLTKEKEDALRKRVRQNLSQLLDSLVYDGPELFAHEYDVVLRDSMTIKSSQEILPLVASLHTLAEALGVDTAIRRNVQGNRMRSNRSNFTSGERDFS